MNNAFKHVTGSQGRTIAVLKNDRFLADASWELVEKYTTIENPYNKVRNLKFESRSIINNNTKIIIVATLFFKSLFLIVHLN